MSEKSPMQARCQIAIEQVQIRRLPREFAHFAQEGSSGHAFGRLTIDVVKGEGVRRTAV
jgi:hypothetical protein